MKLIEKVTGLPKKAKEKACNWIEEHPVDFAIYALLAMGAVGGGIIGYSIGNGSSKKTYSKGWSKGWNDNEHVHWNELCKLYNFPDSNYGYYSTRFQYDNASMEEIVVDLENLDPSETFSGVLVRDKTVKQLDKINW
jgi:hypothetical protein